MKSSHIQLQLQLNYYVCEFSCFSNTKEQTPYFIGNQTMPDALFVFGGCKLKANNTSFWILYLTIFFWDTDTKKQKPLSSIQLRGKLSWEPHQH